MRIEPPELDQSSPSRVDVDFLLCSSFQDGQKVISDDQ